MSFSWRREYARWKRTRYILGEVAFEQQIPEPTTLTLLALAGGAALPLLMRRRRL